MRMTEPIGEALDAMQRRVKLLERALRDSYRDYCALANEMCKMSGSTRYMYRIYPQVERLMELGVEWEDDA